MLPGGELLSPLCQFVHAPACGANGLLQPMHVLGSTPLDGFSCQHSARPAYQSAADFLPLNILPKRDTAMLTLTTGSSRDCDRVHRRSFLQVGALAGLGVSLPLALAAKKARRPRRRPASTAS